MTLEQIVTMAKIYNSLLTVETKGTNTMTMAKCLEALKELIIQIQGEKGDYMDGN